MVHHLSSGLTRGLRSRWMPSRGLTWPQAAVELGCTGRVRWPEKRAGLLWFSKGTI